MNLFDGKVGFETFQDVHNAKKTYSIKNSANCSVLILQLNCELICYLPTCNRYQDTPYSTFKRTSEGLRRLGKKPPKAVAPAKRLTYICLFTSALAKRAFRWRSMTSLHPTQKRAFRFSALWTVLSKFDVGVTENSNWENYCKDPTTVMTKFKRLSFPLFYWF